MPHAALLQGRYRLETSLGSGSMGTVHLAIDTVLRRQVAIKILHNRVDRSIRTHVRDEALAQSRLNHPNVAAVYDFGSDGATDFLVMEYVQGTTLDALLGDAPFDESRVISLGIQLGLGLAAAHDARVIHGDIKPSNIRVTADDVLKIVDFGVATCDPVDISGDTTASGSSPTRTLAGTLEYMSPERLRGDSADARDDVFSAGVVLYQMACGRRPFEVRSPLHLMELILHAAPRCPRSVHHSVSEPLNAVIMRAMHKDLSTRYASGARLVEALRGLTSGVTPPRSAIELVPAGRRMISWVSRVAGSLMS